MVKEIWTGGSLEVESMNYLMSLHEQDELCKGRLEGLKDSLVKISKAFEKRRLEIDGNAAQYLQPKVADLQYNLAQSITKEVQELVDAKGFKQDIDFCVKELKKEEPKNDIEKLTQTMKEIEVRNIMRESGDNFQALFGAEIIGGTPLIIEAIENSPAPFPIDPGMLADGKEQMLNVRKPLLYKRYQAFLAAQSDLETMANQVAPVQIDKIAELAEGK